MEKFICTKFEGYNPGRASQKALRTILPLRGQSTVIYIFEAKGYISNDVLTVYTIQICMYKVSP